jgi:hypothetical protein
MVTICERKREEREEREEREGREWREKREGQATSAGPYRTAYVKGGRWREEEDGNEEGEARQEHE